MQEKIFAIHPQHKKCYDLTPFFQFIEDEYGGDFLAFATELEDISIGYLKKIPREDREYNHLVLENLRKSLRSINYHSLNYSYSTVKH